MRSLVALTLVLCLVLLGCSDDDNPADGGTDAAVAEASVDVGQEVAVEEAGPTEGGVDAAQEMGTSDATADDQGGDQ